MAGKKKGDKEQNQQEPKFKNKQYERELRKLQTRLVEMQEWVKTTGAKIVVVFEGRDAAGKGGVIHRFTQRRTPRVSRVAALAAPSERERIQCS